jgi:hypothetical protein
MKSKLHFIIKTFLLLSAICNLQTTFAQAPQKMSYQAVIRNSSGALVASTSVGIRISILQNSSSGTSVYTETQTTSTNANGLVSLEIGTGTVVSGTFSAINWAVGTYFIKTETDPTGGSTYTIVGVNQLMSVPYALFAASGNVGATGATGPPGIIPAGSSVGNTTFWNGSQWVTNNNFIYNDGSNIGINTATPEGSSILDLSSTSKGFLPPRMTTSQRDAIVSKAEGLTIFNISTKCFEVWSGLSWISMCEGACVPAPSDANAGPDFNTGLLSYTLNANTPSVGIGTWTILSGVGGTLSNINSPNAILNGVFGTSYNLAWTINNSCGTSSDQVTISFGCLTGFANCNGMAIDGCEINIMSSATNCGGCGIVCTVANGTAGCSGGFCFIASCNPGYANCDGVFSNGCETYLSNTVNNCGTCNAFCLSVPNGVSACFGGNCVVSSCNSGYGNCNGSFSDGCEVNLSTSNSNCGACGTVCPLGKTCIGGVCQ